MIASLAGFVLLAGLRAARSEPQRLQRSVATGALAGVLALGVHSLFDFNLHLPSNALLFAALAAVLLAYVPAPAHPRGLAGLTGAAVLASLALALTTTWHSARYDPEPLRRAGPLAATALRRATLEGEARRHLSERPAEARAWIALAWLEPDGNVYFAATCGLGRAARSYECRRPRGRPQPLTLTFGVRESLQSSCILSTFES